MKIFGIGTDIVNIKRMEKSLKRHGTKFKKRVFSEKKLIIVRKKRTPAPFTQKDLLPKKLLVKL